MRFLISLLSLVFLVPAWADLRPTPLRGEESNLAEAIESCGHTEPQVASRGTAGFLAVWLQEGNVVARRVAAGGLPEGAQIAVSTVVPGSTGKASAVRVARGADGTFLVLWLNQTTATRRELLLRRLGEDGTPTGAAVVVASSGVTPALGPAALAVASTGLYGVAWSELDTSGGASSRVVIKVRRFNAAGSPIGGTVILATVPKSDLAYVTSPQIDAAFPAPGSLVVAWTRSRDGAVFARTLTDAVPFGSEPRRLYAGSSQQREQRVELAATGGGEVLAAWLRGRDLPGISLHLLDASAQPESGADANFLGPSPGVQWVDGLTLVRDPESESRYAVLWSESEGSDSEAVYARIVANSGSPFGPRFRVDEPTGDTFGPEHHVTATQLSFGPGGKLAATWQVWHENPFQSTSCDTGVAARLQTFEIDEDPVVAPPEPPAGPYLSSPAIPGFRYKVRLAGAFTGRTESSCLAQTGCVSGAVPGRAEVLLRVVGPRPNGRLWPTIVRFTTSQVEVWLEQTATGTRRYYLLPALEPDSPDLGGTVDRDGFPVP